MSGFGNISKQDLRSNETLGALFVTAAVNTWWPNSNPAMLEFCCLAEKALEDDTQGTPGRLFHALVKRGDGSRVTNAQEVRAMSRFPGCERDRLVCIVEERLGATTPTNRASQPALFDRNGSLGGMHSIMVQCVMPQQRPPDRHHVSRHGLAVLEMQAGSLADPGRVGHVRQLPLPYGSRARLILPYINGYGTRHRTREIDLGESLRKFMERLGIDVNGREAHAVVEQVEALAATQITLHEWGEGGARTTYTGISDSMTFWVKRDQNQAVVWKSSMTLSDKYYEALVGRSVPINMDHLLRLTKSPRRMDLYTWLAYKCARLPKRRRVAIACADLQATFSPEGISGSKNFHRKLLGDLKAICAIHPFRVHIEGDMLVLQASTPPVTRLPK